MKQYVQPTIEAIEFTEEEVVMNLVASSDTGTGTVGDGEDAAVPVPSPPQTDGDADI